MYYSDFTVNEREIPTVTVTKKRKKETPSDGPIPLKRTLVSQTTVPLDYDEQLEAMRIEMRKLRQNRNTYYLQQLVKVYNSITYT